MPRWVRIVLIILAIAVAVTIASYALFMSSGEEPPRTGTGETITGLTSP